MRLIPVICTAALLAVPLRAESTGPVYGTVTGVETGKPLAGAALAVDGTNLTAVTGDNGRYRIDAVPAGERTITVTYIGYTKKSVKTAVSADAGAKLDVQLASLYHDLPKQVVVATREGQVRAFNKQKTADNIMNVIASDFIARYPDQNSAEAMQRIPGITVQRDQGEGRYVQIRGAKPQYANVSINGIQVPAPEGDGRSVALDVVPSDVLGGIEVSKALTPDMDGDAIAGNVNLTTVTPADGKLRLSGTASGGYNDIVGGGAVQGSFSVGKRVLGDKLGFMVSSSYMRTDRGSDNNEFGWGGETFNTAGGMYDEDDSTQTEQGGYTVLEELELRDYVITRDRMGVTGALDYRIAPGTEVFTHFLFNRFGDYEHRYGKTVVFDDGDYTIGDFSTPEQATAAGATIEKSLKDRDEVQDIVTTMAGGRTRLGPLALDAAVSHSYASETEPDRYDSKFAYEGVDLALDYGDTDYPSYRVTAGDEDDPDNYVLDKIEYSDNVTRDRNTEFALNAAYPLRAAAFPVELKAGVKYRVRSKERENSTEVYEWDGNDDLTLAGLTGDHEDADFLNGEYDGMTGFMDDQAIKDFLDANRDSFEVETDIEELYAASYEATENVTAGYLQARAGMGKFSCLAGARVEMTGIEYTGYDVWEDSSYEDGPPPRITSTADFMNVLPMAHLKYALLPNTNVRAAYTQGFVRPDFYDLVPYKMLNDDGDEMEKGNPDLAPATSMNVDLLAEHYFASVGVVSAGFFYKAIDGFMYTQLSDDDGIEVSQTVNGGGASLLGLELALEQRFTFLPGWLDGFGVSGNYTYTSSNAEIEPEAGGDVREISLPCQAAHSGNVSLSYEKFGFTGRIALNFHSDFLDEVGEDPEDDAYYDSHKQIDVSASHKVWKDLYVFTEVMNLTNAPLRYYSVVDDEEMPLQQEYYSWWMNAGVKYSF